MIDTGVEDGPDGMNIDLETMAYDAKDEVDHRTREEYVVAN